MLAICLLATFVLILDCSALRRAPPVHSPGTLVLYKGTPGPIIFQAAGTALQPHILPSPQQVAYLLRPRQAQQIYAQIPENLAQPQEVYYEQPLIENIYPKKSHVQGNPDAYSRLSLKTPRPIYPQYLTNPYSQRALVPKKNVQQFLKEVSPTTKTAYSEYEESPLLYSNVAALPVKEQGEEAPKYPGRKITRLPYHLQQELQQEQSEVLQYNKPQQQYHQHIQYEQLQQYIQPKILPRPQVQYEQPKEGGIVQQKQYQPPALRRQQAQLQLHPQIQLHMPQDNAAYYPGNPLLYQENETTQPTPKSSIFVSQRNHKKSQRLTTPKENKFEYQIEKVAPSPRARTLRPILRNPPKNLQPESYLAPLDENLADINSEGQEELRYQQAESGKFQQVQPPDNIKLQLIEIIPLPNNLVFQQVQPKTVRYQELPASYRQQQQPTYLTLPQIQQEQHEPVTYNKVLTLKPLVHVQPQILTIQQVHQETVRVQPQIQPTYRLQQVSQETVRYRHAPPQTSQQLHLQPEQPSQESLKYQYLQPQAYQPQIQSHVQYEPDNLNPQVEQTGKLRYQPVRSRNFRPTTPSPAPTVGEYDQEPEGESQDEQEEYKYQQVSQTQQNNVGYRRPLYEKNLRFVPLRSSPSAEQEEE